MPAAAAGIPSDFGVARARRAARLCWFLTDDADNPRRWRLPATNLLANGHVVVFASGKDRRTPGRPLHTDFRLGTSGEYLALETPL